MKNRLLNMKKQFRIGVLMPAFICCWVSIRAAAQDLDALIAKYPNDYAVILNYNKDTRIFIKDGQPQAETKVSVEILVLDDKANGSYNKYRVYHGSFNDLKDLEAYTKVPDGRGYKKNYKLIKRSY